MYAFGSPDPGYIGEDIGSVRRLAKACTEMMLKLQPHGPYFLAGYSFGGLVATEMAAILQESGKETAQLIMIDTLSWLPEAKSNQSFFMENFGSSATRDSILNVSRILDSECFKITLSNVCAVLWRVFITMGVCTMEDD